MEEPQIKLSANMIREKFLDFFKTKHQHTIVESSSLIPDNPTVMLTTAGMLQFVPIFLGYESPNFESKRAVSCQKCARAGGKDSDIENVGRTPRHHTFFEMLGNFSFGDYFKKEIIPWSWDFIINYLKLEPERLWITVYEDDDEAFKIWEQTGVDKSRILKKGKKDNFWGPPGETGPCGPCSEIHYDLGEHFKCSENCSIATCECDRWVEIWNLVFMELFQDENGKLTPLENKNVDTGMGLERIAMVVQGKTSTFETDLLFPILDAVCKLAKVEYGAASNTKSDTSIRIITDHLRCVSFIINDGIIPSNEGRGYVLRMILRRALRHGKLLGLELPFLHNLVDVVVENYQKAYPELIKNAERIKNVIKIEEERFAKTLDNGYKILEELIAKGQNISGQDVFKLYDTFGFPLELTVEIANESGLSVDADGFKVEMQAQQQRAREAMQKIVLTDDLIYVDIEKKHGATEFLGYEKKNIVNSVEAKIIEIVVLDDFQTVVDVILNKTPFYAESGGQIGDTGFLDDNEVLNTFKVGKLFVHRVKTEHDLKVGDIVNAKVDEYRRKNVTIHHSNAHLLQAALVKVLGDEVKQAGSQVEQTRTRFDFMYPRAMTKEEIKQVENLINEWIAEGLTQKTEVMDIEQAKKTGAMALFGEKYESKVRVVGFDGVSTELCGGTHVENTSEIRLTKIISESAISSGTRRIEAVCGDNAFKYLDEKADVIDKLAQTFKTVSSEVESRVAKLSAELKILQNETGSLKAEIAKNKFSTFASFAKEIKGGKLFVRRIEGFEPAMVKTGADMLFGQLGESIVVLASVSAEDVFILAKVSDSFVKRGIDAGKIVGEITASLGGKGGGRANFAQGAGKITEGNEGSEKLIVILEKIESDLKNALNQ